VEPTLAWNHSTYFAMSIEQAYRFNNRKKPMDDSARFYDLLSRVAGRRVTYRELTGKLHEEAF
jgi:hypothetical protein